LHTHHVSQLLNPLLVVLLAFLCLTAIAPVQAFHFPWDQGHDTTNPNDPNDPGPCEGPECENDPCNGSSTGSPVYLATGQLIWSETDIVLKGRPAFRSIVPLIRMTLVWAYWVTVGV